MSKAVTTPAGEVEVESAATLATYRNGSGYDVVRLADYTCGDACIVARDVDGNRHVWTTGADVHIQEVSER